VSELNLDLLREQIVGEIKELENLKLRKIEEIKNLETKIVVEHVILQKEKEIIPSVAIIIESKTEANTTFIIQCLVAVGGLIIIYLGFKR